MRSCFYGALRSWQPLIRRSEVGQGVVYHNDTRFPHRENSRDLSIHWDQLLPRQKAYDSHELMEDLLTIM